MPPARYCPQCGAPLATRIFHNRERGMCAFGGYAHYVNSAVAAAGGTLYQDIATQVAGALNHRSEPKRAIRETAHPVQALQGSRLAQAKDLSPDDEAPHVTVNSSHHQAIRDVAPSWIVAARWLDGVIEAIEPPASAASWVVGVQWHPERLYARHDPSRALFRSFSAACQRWMP